MEKPYQAVRKCDDLLAIITSVMLRLLQRQAQNQLAADIGSTGGSLAAALIQNPEALRRLNPETNTIIPDG